MSELFNAAGVVISPNLARRVRLAAIRACHWLLHPAQKAIIENCAIAVNVINTKPPDARNGDVEAEDVLYSASCDVTMCGIAVVEDLQMPEDVIELRFGDEVLATVMNLAKPVPY